MTWLLVSISPSALITVPVLAAASLSYRGVVLMIAGPGLTLVTMACSPPDSWAAEEPGAGTAPLPGRGNARAAGPQAVAGQESAAARPPAPR
jgi:hypothetical protein